MRRAESEFRVQQCRISSQQTNRTIVLQYVVIGHRDPASLASYPAIDDSTHAQTGMSSERDRTCTSSQKALGTFGTLSESVDQFHILDSAPPSTLEYA